MNNSSSSLILIIAGARILAAKVGVTLGVMRHNSQPTVSHQQISPNVTLSPTPEPEISTPPSSTGIPEETKIPSSVASVTLQALSPQFSPEEILIQMPIEASRQEIYQFREIPSYRSSRMVGDLNKVRFSTADVGEVFPEGVRR